MAPILCCRQIKNFCLQFDVDLCPIIKQEGIQTQHSHSNNSLYDKYDNNCNEQDDMTIVRIRTLQNIQARGGVNYC